mmetsp:Transcript_11810/g.35374  ORF Transcript_11810/g.35374 Transcript_11810/m.35374 type:complete len:255 (+) Transcript_11810:214-978(+)
MEAPAPANGEVDDPFSTPAEEFEDGSHRNSEGDAAAEPATSLEEKFSAVSLSQDLDANGQSAGAAPVGSPGYQNGSLQHAESQASELPPSDVRIDSDAFFQDEDAPGTFTLDDASPPLSPTAPEPSMQADSSSLQAGDDRAAQDREDEAIQARLRATLGAPPQAPPDAAPSLSERPMSPPRGAAPRIPLPPPGVEPEEFKGLLFYDGRDNVNRPVVVINARADAMLQPKMRTQAMNYMKARLEPIVREGAASAL